MPSHQCAYCNRRFARTEHLLRHARSHTKEKPFKCGTCGKTYARDDTLIRHAKSHCVNSSGKMTLLEALSNLGEDGVVCNEEQSAVERITPISTPGNMEFSNTSEIGQAQLQGTATSALSPVQHIADLSTGANLWDFNHIEFMDESPWEAINNSFLINEGDTAGAFGQSHDLQPQDPNYASNSHVPDGQDYLETIHPPAVPDLRNVWFTRVHRSAETLNDPLLSREAGGSINEPTLPPSEPELVDECRRGLTNALIRPFPQDDLLPSSEFINLCVRRYLKCFNPVFPILHVGTFQPTSDNSLLVISMASIGCLFLGSQAAVQRGHRIFEILNRAILASWENVVGRTSGEGLAMVQAAIIGQTFAMLSGDARHSAIFDTYHGSLISFARREKMFEARPDTGLLENLSGDELEAAWRKWARREEMARVWFALKVHDAELSTLLHREPLLKHVISQEPLQMRAQPFLATTAANWASAVKQDAAVRATVAQGVHRPHPEDFFAAYVKLEDIGVNIVEDRRQGQLDEAALNSYQQILQKWHKSYSECAGEEQPDQSCLIILWHWTYMTLLVDFDKLESAIGRDGPEAAHDAITYVLSWASTPNSSRCMLHAFLIQKQLQLFRFDRVPPIHTPRIAFSAAIAWHCYIHHGGDSNAFESSTRLSNTGMPELKGLGADSHSHMSYISSLRWSQHSMSPIKAATLCELGGLLQRMNEWGLAKKFAGIVACLIDGGLLGETTY